MSKFSDEILYTCSKLPLRAVKDMNDVIYLGNSITFLWQMINIFALQLLSIANENMKRTSLTFIMTAILLAVSLMGFGQQNKKADKIKNNINEPKKEVGVIKEDSTSTCQEFIKQSKERISNNENKIADLKANEPNAIIKVKEKYDENIFALEQKNNDLKERIKNCTNMNAWETFKIKFNHDMDELETYINIDINTLVNVKQ